MDRLRKLWHGEQPYEPLEDGSNDSDTQEHPIKDGGFSYITYGIFFLLGISMLWAWVCVERVLWLWHVLISAL